MGAPNIKTNRKQQTNVMTMHEPLVDCRFYFSRGTFTTNPQIKRGMKTQRLNTQGEKRKQIAHTHTHTQEWIHKNRLTYDDRESNSSKTHTLFASFFFPLDIVSLAWAANLCHSLSLGLSQMMSNKEEKRKWRTESTQNTLYFLISKIVLLI